MEVIAPGATAEAPAVHVHERVGRPGRGWGFVDTSKVNSDVFLAALEAELGGGANSITVRKPAPGESLSEADLDRLAAACDTVVLGFGDCGTSMSYAVRDAANLHAVGVTPVVVCSDAFGPGAHRLSQLLGLQNLAVIELPHPLASRTSAQISDLAREAAPRIASGPREPRTLDDKPGTSVPPRLSLSDETKDAIEELHVLGWTDGLPVVPASPAAVEEMLEAVGLRWDQTMPGLPPAGARASADRWAANAVMAGCLPDHFQVVLAAMHALLSPGSGLPASQVATNTSTPLLVLNGPIRRALQSTGGYNALGPGSRATASIGRAVRLILQNIGGERSGTTDLATHGQPGKFTYCFAENEEESPWLPWHVSRGFDANVSTVTVVMASAPQNIFAYGCNTSADLIDHLVDAMTALGNNNILFDTGPILVLGPEHAHLLARSGLGREELQQVLFERARIDLDRLPAPTRDRLRTRRRRWFEIAGDDGHIGMADRIEDIHVLVSGGPGIHSQFISTSFSAHPITRVIVPRIAPEGRDDPVDVWIQTS